MNTSQLTARQLLLAPALLVTLLLGSAAAGAKPAPPANADRPPKADRDGDRIFEDLEARLAQLGPNERVDVLVTLTAPASAERVDATSKRVGGFVVKRRFAVVDAFAASVNKGQAEALTHVPWVAHVEEDSAVRALNDGARSSFGVTKARADAPSLDGDADGSPGLHSAGDLVAAVIDTGIHASHLDLDEGKVIGFKDLVNGRTEAYDDNGHGTHVAATIAGDGDARTDGRYAGVAPAAALVGVKVLDGAGNGTMSGVTAGIEWVVQNKATYGIEVVNLSLGAAGCSDGTDATSQAVDAAQAAGLVVAVAAGNEGPGTCTIGAPGSAKGALTVGAMADVGAGGFSLASFSSRGKTADGRVKPDLVAPGVGVTSAQHGTTAGYVSFDGTSMATPFVAGVALLALDANPTLSPAQVRSALGSTTVDWGKPGADGEYGAGRLDAYAALAAAGAPLTAPPATAAHTFAEGTLPGTGSYVDYKLSVNDLGYPIAATLIIPGLAAAAASSPDFDLYLYDPSGRRVAAAETVARQENVTFVPGALGTYTLRVASYAGSGAYQVDVSAGLGVDSTAPTVSSFAPAAGATGVSTGANVTVAFSEAMDTAPTQAAFTLVRSSDSVSVSGTFTWSGATMTFDPSSLAAGTQYTATVATSAKDLAGNSLAEATTWSFTTAAAATSVDVAPSSVSLYSGSVRSGGAAALGANDNVFFAVNSTTSGTRLTDWYGYFKAVPNGLTSLKVASSQKSSASCDQRLYLYNWSTGAWVQLNRRTVGTSETEFSVSAGGTLANYVSGASGDGDTAVRLRCARSDAVNFFTSTDLLRVTYQR
jgi:serine protease AprX